ncbi:MAG: DUF3492 domain-containing protein [Candidatus Acidulodesulfobacterium acidiphilum]|uniref:DUF3492 domain-containing protein n=1 Tax=Candidatus Acidulodesulfobacterium acidiphilum TaxID=2597224 RepID=A0A520XDM2_9DELT|nr:MAG: DUF3492 domain-containing protein [Candidatus Acidulodesulfobacterium acidiphilum]
MEKSIIENKNKPIKVLLVCEGTFPYVRGGVSTWIYQIIKGLPHINFGIVFMGAGKNDYKGLEYDIPDNLVYMSASYLFDDINRQNHKYSLLKEIIPIRKKTLSEKFNFIKKMHAQFNAQIKSDFPDRIKSLDFYFNFISEDFFLRDRKSWEFIKEEYLEFAYDLSFTDYFWTIRNIHAPIWKIANIAREIPSFEIVHSPSTGYAGFLSSILKHNRKSPFILTEHGIYVRERKIDILNSDMASVKETVMNTLFNAEHLKNVWIKFFEALGKLSYVSADNVISLFNDARTFQVNFGADSNKTQVIPNGVDIKKLSLLLKQRQKEIPKIVALIGRVVQIKDVKTFIKSIKLASDANNQIQGWIVGPEDEDEDYVKECKDMVAMLGMESNCLFLGFKNIYDILPKIGLLTLTSISEGMPLVVLEAFSAGIPAICTDVGACSQLINGGLDEDDMAIGKAGEIVPIANPQIIAKNYVAFLTDEQKWRKAQSAALERVNRYYSIESMLENYNHLYEEAS